MASKRVFPTLGSIARPAARRTPAVAACARASFIPIARPVGRIGNAISRPFATHAPSNDPPMTGTPPMVGAQLRAAIESELHALSAAVSSHPFNSSHVHRYLRPLTPEEVELANMGQVPALPGGQVMALLDLNLLPAPFDREKPTAGPDGKGVAVPLLAMVGTTEPAIPCYPFGGLFEQRAPRVVRAVHGVLDAQRKSVAAAESTEIEADERSPLVALMAPDVGEKRDLAIQLAVALFRLAMHEGNGHQEEIATE